MRGRTGTILRPSPCILRLRPVGLALRVLSQRKRVNPLECAYRRRFSLQPNSGGSRMVRGVAEADDDLVGGALSGSERAFQELVRRYERPVFSVILRVIRDPSRAEELAQDTFVKAFLRLETYQPERKFSTWLLTIAHHVAIDEVRRGSLRTSSLEDAAAEYLSKETDGNNPYDVTEQK